jgi:23S rRNA (uracil1939-C5)-methyltransferase
VSILEKDILMDAGVFFQSNGTMLEFLVRDLLAIGEQAESALPMADIYCGVGTFAAFLKDRFPRIDLVEENKTALTIARENIGTEGKNFFALRDDQWVRQMGGGKKPYALILADPPRQGLSAGIRRWLCEWGPPLLCYVSCDPATLARDCGELMSGGYALDSLTFYDFYPQTAHIESLAVLKRNRAARDA